MRSRSRLTQRMAALSQKLRKSQRRSWIAAGVLFAMLFAGAYWWWSRSAFAYRQVGICSAEYARARNAADTAAIDKVIVPDYKGARPVACGAVRKLMLQKQTR